MTITTEATRQNEVWPGSSITSFTGSEPVCTGSHWSHRSLVLVVLAVSIGLACWFYLDPGSVSLTIVIIIGQVGVRKTYRLSVKVDPKINAFLILEKARTGKSISELVETIFREYQAQRNDKSSSAPVGTIIEGESLITR